MRRYADLRVLFEDDYVHSLLRQKQCSVQTRGAGTDHDHVSQRRILRSFEVVDGGP